MSAEPTRSAQPPAGAPAGAFAVPPAEAPHAAHVDPARARGEESPTPAAPAAPAWRRWTPLVLVVLGAALGWLLLGDRLSFDAVRENRADLLAWRDQSWPRAAAIYALAYVAVVAFSLPGALAMTLTGGFLFGPVAGAALAAGSATIGATLIFLAARGALGPLLERRLAGNDGFLARLRAGVAANQAPVLLTMRLVPVVPFFIANLAPAFLGVRTWTYIWTTALGILPGAAVYAWTGAGLGAVFDAGGSPDLGLIFRPQVLGPLLALAALSALPAILRARRGRRDGA